MWLKAYVVVVYLIWGICAWYFGYSLYLQITFTNLEWIKQYYLVPSMFITLLVPVMTVFVIHEAKLRKEAHNRPAKG